MLNSYYNSPLDLHYQLVWSWDATQLEAYCRCAVITFENYIQSDDWPQPSAVLNRALKNIKDSCRDVYKLNEISDYSSTDIAKRLGVIVDFIQKVIAYLDNKQIPSEIIWKIDGDTQESFYDSIAYLMFEIVLSVALVNGSPDKCWNIHYVVVWDGFFRNGHENGKARKIINYKLRRLIYNEICRLNQFPNYTSSKVLGFCLNVMGLKLGNKKYYNGFPLHKLVLKWVKSNYLQLRIINPDVAESCIIGSISFDEKNNQIVKTYAKGIKPALKEYLLLDQ